MRRLVVLLCLAFLPATAAADINGMWVGYYEYEGGSRVECAALLETIENMVGGVMIERRGFLVAPNRITTSIAGTISGSTFNFTKQYYTAEIMPDGAPVEYTLQISPDGHTLTGFWKIGAASGRAWFRRVTTASADRLPVPQ